MSKSNLLSSDLQIVEKRKIWFSIPAVIVVIAIICGIGWGIATGMPLSLSMDFAGGYEMKLDLSTKLTDDTFPDYEKQINSIAESISDENGKPYGLTISSLVRQGDGESASISIRYKTVRGADMDTINDKFVAELNKLFEYRPSLSYASGKFTAVYTDPIMSAEIENMRLKAEELGFSADIKTGDNDKTLVVETAVTEDQALQFLSIPDKYSGKTEKGRTTDALISTEYLIDAILAIALALTLMLIYIAFRFEVSAGIAAVLALTHDLLLMFAAMTIFHIEIGVTFIAALITILGYSINNTIIIFDRIREKTKPFKNQTFDSFKIANEAVRDTLWRSINTTITTLIPITLIVLIGFLGVPSIQIFGFPIIIGLLAGTYSSVFISPSIWGILKRFWQKGSKRKEAEKAILTKKSNA